MSAVCPAPLRDTGEGHGMSSPVPLPGREQYRQPLYPGSLWGACLPLCSQEGQASRRKLLGRGTPLAPLCFTQCPDTPVFLLPTSLCKFLWFLRLSNLFLLSVSSAQHQKFRTPFISRVLPSQSISRLKSQRKTC